MSLSQDARLRLTIALASQGAGVEVANALDAGGTSGASPSYVNLTLTGLLTESATGGITAHAGGGQGSATQLTTEVNRVTTVATAGDSVVLPASSPGLTIIVSNEGANPMQVYGLGTDTVNGVASGTGVSQMPSSECLYVCTAAGVWKCNDIGQGFSGNFPTTSYQNGITAHAGGGQGSATPLTTMNSRVTVVATNNDSVLLPPSAPGITGLVVTNAATNSMNVFPATGDAVNALSANAAFAVAGGKTAMFSCAVAGTWHAVLSA